MCKQRKPWPRMLLQTLPKPRFFVMPVVVTFIFLLFNGAEGRITNIGAIIDKHSHIGKEEIIAMKVAVHNYNSNSTNHKLSLHIRYNGRGPFQTAMAAKKLIRKDGVEVIVGTETWEEAAIVADIGSQAKVPVLSFAAPAITPPSISLRWPFLIRMASNYSEQMKCIAALAQSYNWRRVVAISEDNAYGGDSGKLDLLAQTLENISAEIEYRLVLPPISSLSSSEETVRRELEKLKQKRCRVFIVLHLSLPMTVHLFREANKTGLTGKDSVWIVTDTIANYLDSLNTSAIYSMEGTLGIKNYYSEVGSSYREFSTGFRQKFITEYPEEDYFQPGIHALRAYDSITVISQAIERLNGNISSPKILLENILSSNFFGLSGKMLFNEGELLKTDKLRIVNVVGRKYKELDFWLPECGIFSSTLDIDDVKNCSELTGSSAQALTDRVTWPGNLNRVPKGWQMPTREKPMRIGVPSKTFFDKFVKVEPDPVNPHENKYSGFCIDLFLKVLEHLSYDLPFKFFAHNGSYDDLIMGVYNKTYDAAVGDVTILENRTNYVEFTQPYAESGLSMIVPAQPEESTWMFTKPFTWELWVLTGASFIYTMLLVWFLEHQNNPEFSGPWTDQIGNALWFTFSSLFFAHSEKIYGNFTRVVVVLWLFVVFVLTSSYTASLSSLLTVRRLEPTLTDIEFLKNNNLSVGCDSDSFIHNYLKQVLHFKSEQIFSFENKEQNYIESFRNNNISAVFLEPPYEKVFLNKYCKGYSTATTYRFGGFGFAFQRGSPMALDFSRTMLNLSETGELHESERNLYFASPGCTANERTTTTPENLTLNSFWVLYLVYGAISMICFTLFIIRSVNNFRWHQGTYEGNINKGVLEMVINLAKYFHYAQETNITPARAPQFAQAEDEFERTSSRRDYASSSDSPQNHRVSSPHDQMV